MPSWSTPICVRSSLWLTTITRSTDSRRARNSDSVMIGGRRRPVSRPSRRRCRFASRRVDPLTPRTPSSSASPAPRPPLPPPPRPPPREAAVFFAAGLGSRTCTTVSTASSSAPPDPSDSPSPLRRRRRGGGLRAGAAPAAPLAGVAALPVFAVRAVGLVGVRVLIARVGRGTIRFGAVRVACLAAGASATPATAATPSPPGTGAVAVLVRGGRVYRRHVLVIGGVGQGGQPLSQV